MSFHVPHHFRLRHGQMASHDGMGNNGFFILPNGLRAMGSDQGGWEHVSVSWPTRTPTWREMCYVKSIFWDPEDTVMQLHPPESTYVNNHPHCLHLWRPTTGTIPLPPSIFVGTPGGPIA